jgi:hypothetical protein
MSGPGRTVLTIGKDNGLLQLASGQISITLSEYFVTLFQDLPSGRLYLIASWFT